MQDHELYQRIADGIAPWTVGEIKVESSAQRLEVEVACSDAVPIQCPHCNSMLLVCDHGEQQTWRQPDDGTWQVLLKARLPLVDCPEHGIIRVAPPWADWYVRGLDNSLVGPWSLQQLKLLLDAGRISPSTLLRRSSTGRWVITGTVSALFVRHDEPVEPPMSADELAAVDWAITNGPTASLSLEETAQDLIASGNNSSVVAPSNHIDGDQGEIQNSPIRGDETFEPQPAQEAASGPREFNPVSEGSGDSDQDTVGNSLSGLKPLRFWAQREPEKLPDARERPNPLERTTAPEKEDRAKGTRKKPVENAPAERLRAVPREPEELPDTGGEPRPQEWGSQFELIAEPEDSAKEVRYKPVDVAPAERVRSAPYEPEELPETGGEPNSQEWGSQFELAVEPGDTAIAGWKKPVDDAPAERVKAAPPEPEKPPEKRAEPNHLEWSSALKLAVKMEHTAKTVRKKPVEDDPAERVIKAPPRRETIVRRRGFQRGYQLLSIGYLINAALMSCMISVVCVIFFSRLLLLSTSVFAPFEGGNTLQEGQLVACGLSAFSILVLIGFPIWYLISNDSTLLYYVPSALLGMTIGFGLPPDYLDEVCAALQWCEVCFGIATVGLTVYTLTTVPAQFRMSVPLIAAGVLTALAALALCFVRPGSMLFVQADVVPPQFRGAIPDAPLFVFGLYGTLVFIPAALLFELYRHVDFSSRQFIIRTGVILGIYVLAGLATLGSFVQGAGAGFFDVPIALVPLACVNALAAAIPSAMLLLDPQYSVPQD